jgi:hypothetical protein
MKCCVTYLLDEKVQILTLPSFCSEKIVVTTLTLWHVVIYLTSMWTNMIVWAWKLVIYFDMLIFLKTYFGGPMPLPFYHYKSNRHCILSQFMYTTTLLFSLKKLTHILSGIRTRIAMMILCMHLCNSKKWRRSKHFTTYICRWNHSPTYICARTYVDKFLVSFNQARA